MLANQREGVQVCTLSYTQFQKAMRSALAAVGVESAREYALHAFRRGFARELLRAKTPLKTILQACGWSSTAFQLYLGSDCMEAEAVEAAVGQALDGSDTEDGGVNEGQ